MTTTQYSPAPFTDTSRFSGDWVIDLRGVEKVYSGRFGRGQVHALRGIDMRVHRGSVFGLLGPNGAGKSTLVKILMTVIRPTRCEGTFLGTHVGHKPTLQRVGYLPEHHRFPEYLTAAQVMDYFGALSDVPRAARKKRIGELLELVGLTNWAHKRVKGFSKGMRQRMGIASALVSDPDLVVLDEPTDGVDPVGRRDIRNVLTRIRDEGRTVFLNSHLLSEMEMICDRVAILVQGKVSSQGTIDELTRDSQRFEIEVESIGGTGVRTDQVRSALLGVATFDSTPEQTADKSRDRVTGTLNGAESPALFIDPAAPGAGTRVTVHTSVAAAIQPVIDAVRANGMALRSLKLARSSLEDLFMQAVVDPATGRTLAPGAASTGKNEAGSAARADLVQGTGAVR